ncbi:phenazine biosynthesis protein PhzF family [Flavobacterium sp. CF108]|uniref:PhzF family isomerase n=1 Tax=unclassified Flavobacterium TaxID=196869 RepID=UPI0008CD4CD6|nr:MULTISPECIES: PhzF family isomerase [unclassified Flavobacterium]SEO92504.1 phenazine biosynthesis protein PhzF family [Flavobacterium sp. fv08]SHH84211.1 phenazine biosynthesis protein PhzF family [Flavobacterium sp. CF108]
MKKLITYQIDSFTKEKFKGNPAGVVVNADGLKDYEMQQIARELNNSETAFLFSPDDNDCDGVIRYFTPSIEVPICGHATIAAMYAKALEDNLDSCVLKMKTKVGILPFEIIKENGDYQIVMTQGNFEASPAFDNSTAKKIIDALGLDNTDIDEKCPIQIASTGHSKVMIGIKSRAKLNALLPKYNDLADLSKQINCNGYFVFTFDSDSKDILTYGRMFAPAIGINEDPVTGNANGPLGGYLIQNNIVDFKDDLFEFNGKQGEKIDRPGIVKVRVTIQNDKPNLIQIKGDAVVVFKTEIEI